MKIIKHMSIGEGVRQGDVCLVKIGEADAPINIQEVIEGGILARGEVTGHIHGAATMDMLSEQDMKFLETVQRKLCQPIVFRDKETVITRTEAPNGVPLVQHRIAKVHAPEPFILAHYEDLVRVVPSDDEAIKRGLHTALLLPAGLYMAIQQVECDEEEEMRRVAD